MKKGDKVRLRGTKVEGVVDEISTGFGTTTNLHTKIVYVTIITPEGHKAKYQIDELKLAD